MGEGPRQAPGEGPTQGRPQAHPISGGRRLDRQPVGQDSGPRKRGTRGFDAGKKIKGRKRHLCVDTLGLILAVVVHSAEVQDRDGAEEVLRAMVGRFGRLRGIWADGGYAGEFVEWARRSLKRVIEIVKKSKGEEFQLLPKRWVVERTFAWLCRYRRLSKDYETDTRSSEAMIHLAMINLMIHRLQKG